MLEWRFNILIAIIIYIIIFILAWIWMNKKEKEVSEEDALDKVYRNMHEIRSNLNEARDIFEG